MTIHLPQDLEKYVRNQVQNGRFASEEELISEAVRRMQQAQAPTLTGREPLSEQEFEQRMAQGGLLSVPAQGSGPRPEFQPIVIKGEPLSETVIRERR